ncbi:UDP-2,3-diacylglucosamine diphosphatase [Fodinibius sediminis]|uniref:UDP-2,3-diacylglucosamine diphosphatase n=1 Tax=Fodinibius sediminis TaxID=1214077 RepID=UPI00163D5C61|nr:UDP-2,3-diacylglucosamine diphosphatase [Fodinibius sediminis]
MTLSPPILFLSDAHLGGFSDAENKRIESDLIQLIDYCRHHEIRIAVLGDLFDYWMEFPGHIPSLGRRLLDRFEEYNRALGPTFYITGNHDNWTFGHLADRGFRVVSEQVELTVDEKKILLLHGDGLADPRFELQRPLVHRILRHPQFIRLYRSLFSPAWALRLMKSFSKWNRKIGSDEEDGAPLTRWAKRQLKNSEYDLVICGHDHIPRMKQFAFGSYINLGTFYQHRTMAYYNNRSIDLVSWDAGAQMLQLFDSTNTIDE